jgi:NAD-dependent SIR2 family protein deacetylase
MQPNTLHTSIQTTHCRWICHCGRVVEQRRKSREGYLQLCPRCSQQMLLVIPQAETLTFDLDDYRNRANQIDSGRPSQR